MAPSCGGGQDRADGVDLGQLCRSAPMARRSASPDSSTHRPSRAMPIGTTSYLSWSRAARTLPAVTQEIACSLDRPPKSTATRGLPRGPGSSGWGGRVAHGGPTLPAVLPGTGEPRPASGVPGPGAGAAQVPASREAMATPHRSDLSPATLAVKAGRPPHEPDQPLNTPVTLASTYVAGGDVEYGRYGNPTWTAFEEALGALEGGRCLAFALRAGCGGDGARPGRPRTRWWWRHVTPTTAASCSSPTWRPAAGCAARLVDVTDQQALLTACEDAALVWLESPTNPALEVIDLPPVIEAAHDGRRLRRGRQHLRHAAAAAAARPGRRPGGALGDEVHRRAQRRADGGAGDPVRGAVRRAQEAARPARQLPRAVRGLAGAARPAHAGAAGGAGPGQRRRAGAAAVAAHPAVACGHLPGIRRRS